MSSTKSLRRSKLLIFQISIEFPQLIPLNGQAAAIDNSMCSMAYSQQIPCAQFKSNSRPDPHKAKTHGGPEPDLAALKAARFFPPLYTCQYKILNNNFSKIVIEFSKILSKFKQFENFRRLF